MVWLGTYPFLALCVAIAIALSIWGLLFVRKIVDTERLRLHHDAAGPFLSIVATLFAVVLGFIVVDALNTFQKARATVEMEANALHDVFHMAGGLPSMQRQSIRALCLEYASCMVNDEWKQMENAQSSARGHVVVQHLWHEITDFAPQTNQETNLQEQMLDEMKEIGDARHSRLLASRPTYDTPLWCVLLIGSAITISFTFFFGFESIRLQMLMTSMVTIVISLNLILVAVFGTPFSGDVRVPPTAFAADANYFSAEMGQH